MDLVSQVWKGFFQRRKTRKEREDEMIFIGMVCFNYYYSRDNNTEGLALISNPVTSGK